MKRSCCSGSSLVAEGQGKAAVKAGEARGKGSQGWELPWWCCSIPLLQHLFWVLKDFIFSGDGYEISRWGCSPWKPCRGRGRERQCLGSGRDFWSLLLWITYACSTPTPQSIFLFSLCWGNKCNCQDAVLKCTAFSVLLLCNPAR